MGATASLSVSRSGRGAQGSKRAPERTRRRQITKRRAPEAPKAARGRSSAWECPDDAEPIPEDLACRMLAAAATKKNGQHVYVMGKGGEPRLRLAAPERLPGLGESVRVTAVAREALQEQGHLLGKRGRVVEFSQDVAQYQVELPLLGMHWFLAAELEPVKFAWPAASSDCGESCSEATSGSTTCSSPRSLAVMDECEFEF